MDTTPKTESIDNIIKGIDHKEIVLPEFQRDFVWDVVKNFDLFDSLIKDIFIGSIIYGVPSFEITVRELDTRPRNGKGSRRKLEPTSYSKEEIESKVQTSTFRIILDGQQRITSIYRALKNIDEVWFICKKINELKDDIKKLKLENILYSIEGNQDEERLSIKLADVYEQMNEELLEAEKREKFFEPTIFVNGYTGDIESLFRMYLQVVGKLKDLFKASKLVSYYQLNTSTEKFALFFERSNSKGIQLNFIDILAAKLYIGFNLREKIEEFENDNPDYILNREVIVRAIAYIVNDGKDIDRSSILSKLNAGHFNLHWDEMCDAYKKTLTFLFNNNFLMNQSWIPYENMLIPLMIFYIKIGKADFSQMNEYQLKFLKYWFWASIFSQRYTSSSNEAIMQDTKILETLSDNKKIDDKSYFKKLRPIITSADDILSYSKKGSVIYKGVLNIINYYQNGLIDWQNSAKLNFKSKLDDHHIFPKEYLKKNYELLPNQIDTVVNRTLIPKITNIKIGAKKPSTYLKELQNSNSKIVESLEKHLIDKNLLNGSLDTRYEEFLQSRSEKIFDILKEIIIEKQSEIINDYLEPKKSS